LDKIWTTSELINWGKNFFVSKNISEPRLNFEFLLCKVLNCNRIDLYLKYDYPFKPNQLSELKELINRRAKFEPLQYILGEVEFYGNKFISDKRALIPRPETELLVIQSKEIISQINKPKTRVLEVGVGTGCVSISLAKLFPAAEFYGIDISQDAIDLAFENKELHKVENIKFKKADFFEFSTFSYFDLIISNPPYIPKEQYSKNNLQEELFFEPKIALTDDADGLVFYRKFAEIIKLSTQKMQLILEINEFTSDIIVELFKIDNVATTKIKDFNNLDRMLIIEKK
jgi:release factor glutamine methyltransferase